SQLYTWAFLRHDLTDMSTHLEAARRLPDGFLIIESQVGLALFQGQLMLAKELTAQFASEMTSRTGLKASAATLWSSLARLAAIYGDRASARASTETALAIDRNVATELNSAFALAAIGDLAQARALTAAAARESGASSDDAQRGLKV